MKSPYFVPPFASALLLALSAPDAAQGRARSSVSSGRTGILLRGTTSDAPVGRILKENDENNKDKNKEKNADAPSVNAETSSVKDMGDDCWGWKSEWTDDEYAPCWDGTYDFTLDPEAPPARCNKHDCGDKTDDWTDVCDLWCDEYGEMTNVPTGTPTSKPTARPKLKAQAETAPAPEAGDQDSVPNGLIAGVAVVAVALTLAMVVVVFIRRQPSSKNAQERPRTPLSKKTDHSSPHSKGTQGIEWDDASEGASKGIVGDASVSYSIDSLRSGGDFRADHDLKRELSLDSEGWGEREDNVVVDVSRRVKDDEEDEDDNIPSWAKDSKPDEFVW